MGVHLGMGRPETRRGGELPAFWFPPQADSIQLRPWLRPEFFSTPHAPAQS